MGITFDDKTGRYRSTDGKFIKQDKVFSLLESYRIQKQNEILKNSDKLAKDGNYDAFLASASKDLKHLHTINYIVGKGGVKRMDDDDIKTLNGILKNELTLNFDPRTGTPYGLEELVNQKEQNVISQAAFTARLKTYTKGSQKSYWKATEKRDKSPYMQRFLHGDNNCASCIEYASVGMTQKGSLPMPGFECECRSNCNCTVTFYTESQYNKYLKNQISNFSDSILAA